VSDVIELTCKQMVELVTDYLEGSLSPDDRARFETHLAVCEGCTRFLAQMRETIRMTGTLAEEQIPPEQRDALLAAFRDWRRP
jgi:predicted anti-sigma-YlaC factor YlaD